MTKRNERIINDHINKAKEFFPDLEYQNNFFQGTIPLNLFDVDIYLPIRISFSDKYPQEQPGFKIMLQETFITENDYVKKDGNLKQSKIYKWDPKKSTLCELLNKVNETFPSHPPINKKMAEQLKNKSNALNLSTIKSTTLTNQTQSSNQQYPIQTSPYSNQGYNQQQQAYYQQQQAYNQQQQAYNQQQQAYNQQQLYSQPSPYTMQGMQTMQKGMQPSQPVAQMQQVQMSQPIPDLQIDPKIEEKAKKQARIQTYHETVAALKELFKNKSIGPEQYFDTIRELAEHHFQNSINEELNQRSQVN